MSTRTPITDPRHDRPEPAAPLLAAAPDLLVLAAAVAAHFQDTDAPLGAQARAAIARATGQVPA